MEHLILNNGSDSAALAKVALKALREARSSKTLRSGSVFVSDGQTDADGIDLGTGTIINGVDGGIQPWVGDTTAPGKPTGITAESHNGAVWVSWDGTLEGGIPADFDHVQVTAVDGSKKVDMGRLSAAGTVTAADLTAGDTVVVTAVAFDDAHDAQGNSKPNASPISDAVPVIVQSAVSADEVQAIQSDLSNAQSDIAAAKASMTDLTATVSTVDGKATTSGSAPTASDATGKPEGAMWYVMDSDCNLTGTYVLKSGSWVKYAWASSSIADEVNQAISDAASAASTAKSTAEGKNKVVRSTSAPSSTSGYSAGDQWWVYSGGTVTALYLFSGSAWVSQTLTDSVISNLDAGKITSGYVDAARIQAGTIDADKLAANSVTSDKIVADAVTSEKLVSEAVTADKLAANSVTAVKIAAGSVTADKADIGSLSAAIVTSGKFQTSNGRMFINDDGLTAKDVNGNITVDIPSDGSTPTMVGGLSTAPNGKHISISQSGDVGKVSLLDDNTELTSLTLIDDTANSGYVYTGLYTGQNGQFLQFATLVDSVNHAPDPLQDEASFTSNGRMGINAANGINVNGTWFARSVGDLPTSPRVAGGAGTRAVVGGVDYVFDGTGLWVSQNYPVTHIDGGNGQTVDWWCIGGVATIEVAWRHTASAWDGGAISSIPESYAPPFWVRVPFEKQNRLQSEADTELQVKPDGSIRWQNLGGVQGSDFLIASVTYHIKIAGT